MTGGRRAGTRGGAVILVGAIITGDPPAGQAINDEINRIAGGVEELLRPLPVGEALGRPTPESEESSPPGRFDPPHLPPDDERRDLWRVVGLDELSDIRRSGRIRPSPGGLEKKYFWGSPTTQTDMRT